MKKSLILFVFFIACTDNENHQILPSKDYNPPKEQDLIFCRENPNHCFCTQKIDCYE